MGPFPFYCHDNIDYKEETGVVSGRKEFVEKGFVLCSGWLEEVRELAKTGYYDEQSLVTKCRSVLARENLEIFLVTEDLEEKQEAHEMLQKLLLALAKKRQRFEPGAVVI